MNSIAKPWILCLNENCQSETERAKGTKNDELKCLADSVVNHKTLQMWQCELSQRVIHKVSFSSDLKS